MSIEATLNEIDGILDEARPVPLTNKVMIDAQAIKTAIEDIRLNMPDEIMQARKVASERRDILNTATVSSEAIIAQAEEKAKTLVQEHEITIGAKNAANEIMQQARSEANELLEAARKEANDMMEQAHRWANDMRTSAGEYVEEIVKTADEALTVGVEEIRRARKQLRVAASRKTDSKPSID
ncbi:MAG: hypothetical protein GX051_01065 [Clostridiales bacterium]|nr:hypothetical protein [Clostridiales bacterium]